MILTPQQEELLNIAKEKGSVTIQDAALIYSSSTARKAALKRLVVLGLIKMGDRPNKFVHVK